MGLIYGSVLAAACRAAQVKTPPVEMAFSVFGLLALSANTGHFNWVAGPPLVAVEE